MCSGLLPHKEPKRQLATTATQVAISMSQSCPFVSSKIGLVKASPQVQEDVQPSLENQDTSGKKRTQCDRFMACGYVYKQC